MLFSASKHNLPSTEQQMAEASALQAEIQRLQKEISGSKWLHYIQKGFNHLVELFCYLLGLVCIAFAFIMNTIFPFHMLGEIISKEIYVTAGSGKPDIDAFHFAVKGLVILVGLLIIWMGFMVRKSGKRLGLLLQTGIVLQKTNDYLSRVVISQPADKTKQTDELKPVALKDFPPLTP